MANYITFIEKEFIFNQLIRNSGRMLLFGTGKNAACTVNSYNKNYLILEGIGDETARFAAWEPVSVYIGYQGQRLMFTSKVVHIDGARINIAFPEKLVKAPQRKSVRVSPPHDLQLEFFLQNDRIHMDCPESLEYLEIEIPEISEGFDTSSLNTLLASFSEKAGARYSINGVVMFGKGRKPESVEERVISQLGRVLLVTSTKSPLPSIDPYPEGRIITQKAADAYEGPSIFLEGSDLEKRRQEKSKQGIISELYCPILYYQYVVGYVYVMNNDSKKVCLDFRAVDFAWEFSRILAYNLRALGYFRSAEEYEPLPHVPAVFDLSTGGCLFMLPKSSSKAKLKQSAIIDLRIGNGESSLSCKGRVIRRFDDKQYDYYGVSFVNMTTESIDFLRRILYADGATRFACDETDYAE
ncbi:MAG: PilZ domain-containing protein [Spirochaetales bacterium]|nr:MAG: PilZ domain-containing protein [Spirochaetales bacterium]